MSEPFLVVGLGNPGPQYEGTRHNVGFAVTEALAAKTGIAARRESRFNALVGAGRHAGNRLIIAQPLTFMNLSGEAVSKLLHYYQAPLERLLVIYDEAALPFGRIRFRPKGSDAGQKGMKSIIESLGGNSAFPRLRIGIGSPPPGMSMPNFVLSRFGDAERPHLPTVINMALDCAETWMASGVETAMERFNGLNALETQAP